MRLVITRVVLWVASAALSFLLGVAIAAQRLEELLEREHWRVPFGGRV